ncbi:MAG: hypothetical protein QM532_02320 [Cyanobium sp. MAG06]|nr:hypothetical protein [Cyanobium sp. MAG06]
MAHRNNGKFTGHNIIFLDNDKMLDDNNIAEPLRGKTTFNGDAADVTISNSFGMPSSSPLQWMPDITEIEKIAKKKNKLIISSVVGTPVADGDIYDLANDYTFTARCAELAGANIIELNLSCPNVCGKEGQIYKSAQDAMIVAKSVRRGLNPKTKLLLKIGYSDIKSYKEFITKTGQYIDGIVAINTIAMKIVDDKGNQALPGGLNSGVCGKIIIDKSVEAVKNLSSAKKALGDKYKHIKIIGCGGVTTPEAFIRHIDAGAEYVMCATSALFNPTLPLQIANYIKENKINIKIK